MMGVKHARGYPDKVICRGGNFWERGCRAAERMVGGDMLGDLGPLRFANKYFVPLADDFGDSLEALGVPSYGITKI